jgi:hypothetical protein
VRPAAIDDRLGSTAVRILLTAALAASAGEIVRRVVPTGGTSPSSLPTTGVVGLSAAPAFRRRT